MQQRISALTLAAYLAFTGFIRGLGKDERGLSGVVVAILLILVAVLAIVLIWVFLKDWLTQLFTDVTSQAGKIS